MPNTAALNEALIFIFGVMSWIGLTLIALDKSRSMLSRSVAMLFSLAYFLLVFFDVWFYLGNPFFVMWPTRPLGFRGLSFVAVSVWLWWPKHRAR